MSGKWAERGWHLPRDVLPVFALGLLVASSVCLEPIFLLAEEVYEGKEGEP